MNNAKIAEALSYFIDELQIKKSYKVGKLCLAFGRSGYGRGFTDLYETLEKRGLL